MELENLKVSEGTETLNESSSKPSRNSESSRDSHRQTYAVPVTWCSAFVYKREPKQRRRRYDKAKTTSW